MGATYMDFSTGTFHVDGDDPLTQDQVDSIWYHLGTTGAGWVERGRFYVQQYDGAKVFDLGPVAAGVKGVSQVTRFGGKKPSHMQGFGKKSHATKKKAVRPRRAHATKKSPRDLQRDIDEVLAKRDIDDTLVKPRAEPDIILRPAADETFAVTPVAATDAVRLRLRRAGINHFLGFDPKSATDRAEIERRIADRVGNDLTIAWDRRRASRSHATKASGSGSSSPRIPSLAEQIELAKKVQAQLPAVIEVGGRKFRVTRNHNELRFFEQYPRYGAPGDSAHVQILREDVATAPVLPMAYQDRKLAAKFLDIVRATLRSVS
jgi:hypothetical protein